ncbi:MAG: class I SAM-dependent methyltransferase [Nitrospirae bacterium]|nr:class I SAM-dependent methyltransferase [Nitrospirota bacterium]
MPVNIDSTTEKLYQWQQYNKGGIGRLYWDYRDKVALNLVDDKDRVIVDLGCGEGITLKKIVNKFPAAIVLGIDGMTENIDICTRLGLPASLGDVYNLDLPENSVDVVLLFEVIEHLSEPLKALREIHRILKPNGKLIIIFPNDGFFKIARILTLKIKEAAYDPGHVKQWTYGNMMPVLKQAGFSTFFYRSIPFFLWPVCLHGVVGARKFADGTR